jgi:hypothetical protein
MKDDEYQFVLALAVAYESNAGFRRRASIALVANVLAVARQYLGSLDRISRVVRLGVYIPNWHVEAE